MKNEQAKYKVWDSIPLKRILYILIFTWTTMLSSCLVVRDRDDDRRRHYWHRHDERRGWGDRHDGVYEHRGEGDRR